MVMCIKQQSFDLPGGKVLCCNPNQWTDDLGWGWAGSHLTNTFIKCGYTYICCKSRISLDEQMEEDDQGVLPPHIANDITIFKPVIVTFEGKPIITVPGQTYNFEAKDLLTLYEDWEDFEYCGNKDYRDLVDRFEKMVTETQPRKDAVEIIEIKEMDLPSITVW